jgi:hypothetical protein
MFWSYGFLFQDGNFGMRFMGQRIGLRTLEFPFSLAIDRGSLFRARTVLFLASAAIPLVTFLVVSFWHPDRRIEIYPTADYAGTGIQSYYVAHYSGATVQVSDPKPRPPGSADPQDLDRAAPRTNRAGRVRALGRRNRSIALSSADAGNPAVSVVPAATADLLRRARSRGGDGA